MRHGEGEFHWPSGSCYRGMHALDERNGFGILYSNTGRVRFKGNWKDGKGHGKGEYHWEDGHYHSGMYENGKAQGEGKFLHEDSWHSSHYVSILKKFHD